jgi:hypothetical protein
VLVTLLLTPSLVAVMMLVPILTPVTSPVADTVATAGFDAVHVTVRPLSVLPSAARVVANSCSVCPIESEGDSGLMETVATGDGVTVIVATALFPSDL